MFQNGFGQSMWQIQAKMWVGPVFLARTVFAKTVNSSFEPPFFTARQSYAIEDRNSANFVVVVYFMKLNNLYQWPCVLDPAPTCEVISTQPIMAGDTVSYNCTMYYYAKGASNLVDPPTIACDSGTVTSAHTALATDRSGMLSAGVEITASGCEVATYNCTATFAFNNPTDAATTYATNSVTYACNCARVPLWCKYIIIFISPNMENNKKKQQPIIDELN